MSIQLSAPNIIVPATDAGSFDQIAATAADGAPWDWVELRLDLFQPPPATLPWPVLLTPRHPSEGGAPIAAVPAERVALCEPWIAHAAGIDIEIAHAETMAGLLDSARAVGLAVVLSFHNFDKTPSAADLEATVRAGVERGADVVKLATRTDTIADADRLLALFDSFPDQKLALMGMGPEGKASRLAAAKRGSVLNYASVGAPTVEGQWPADEFSSLLEQSGAR